MTKTEIKYFEKIRSFLKSLHFFDDKFFNYIEDKIQFIKNLDTDTKKSFAYLEKNKISLFLPYPNNYKNALLCLDGFCEAYFYYLIKHKRKLDNNYLETLKESVRRIYVEEKLSIKSINKYNENIFDNLNNLDDASIIGIALSFEIANNYANTSCFLIPDEYYFDANKTRKHVEDELEYLIHN